MGRVALGRAAEVAALLDQLDVPIDASTRTAQAALEAAGKGRRRNVVMDAMRHRKANQ